jgi:transcriptional regulator with XRE-family HTH domain
MKRINKEIARLMGQNLRHMRLGRGWSQEQLAELTGTDKRYVSAMENGRGIGKNMLDRLCVVFGADEDAFTLQSIPPEGKAIETFPRVTRMILEELEGLPEYEQLRLLAELVERRCRKLEGAVGGKGPREGQNG